MARAQITTDAIAACVEGGVQVTALRRNGAVRFAVRAGTTGSVLLRLAQVRAADSPEQRASLARCFVGGKLQNCRRLLRRYSWDHSGQTRRDIERVVAQIEERIINVRGVESEDRIRGIEGDAARQYFKGLDFHLIGRRSEFRFAVRTRRPPRDPVNALLSFVYGLVLSEVTGALEGVGLDPQIGYLHGVRPGRPSLALDLVEEFRPAIADRFAIGLLTKRVLSTDAFTVTPGGACYLSDDGRRRVISEYEEYKSGEVLHTLLDRRITRSVLPGLQATLLARRIRGDLAQYPPFVLAD